MSLISFKRRLEDIFNQPCLNCGKTYNTTLLARVGYHDYQVLCLDCLKWMVK